MLGRLQISPLRTLRLPAITRRRWFRPFKILAVFWFLAWCLQISFYDVGSNSHDMSVAHSTFLHEGWKQDVNGYFPRLESAKFCNAHNFPLWRERHRRRKIYDLFMLNTELDWLEIRLNELYDEVDYFVIVESPRTFTGLPKGLALQENWAKFEKWHDKIIHHVLDIKDFWSTVTWDHEDRQRNAMFDHVFPFLNSSSPQAPQWGDAIMVSDVDEIPRKDTMTILRECAFPKRLTLRSQFYYYGFQWQHMGEQWAHPQVTYFTSMDDTLRPAHLRNGDGGGWRRFFNRKETADLWNAAWHCSSCFSTLAETLNKMSSFSHTRWNLPAFREPRWIVEQVRNGRDLFNRTGELYRRVDHNQDVPSFLKAVTLDGKSNLKVQNRFAYLLDRDPVNANFVDLTPEEARTSLGQTPFQPPTHP